MIHLAARVHPEFLGYPLAGSGVGRLSQAAAFATNDTMAGWGNLPYLLGSSVFVPVRTSVNKNTCISAFSSYTEGNLNAVRQNQQRHKLFEQLAWWITGSKRQKADEKGKSHHVPVG